MPTETAGSTERHLDRDPLERAAYTKLLGWGTPVADELAQAVSAGEPVTPAFWAKTQEQFEAAIGVILAIMFLESFHGWDIEEQGDFAATQFATNRARWLADRFMQTTLKRYVAIRDRLAAATTDSQREEAMDSLRTLFGESRMRRIAKTEATRAISAGTVAASRRLSARSQLIWRLGFNENHCPLCVNLDGTPQSFWGKFVDGAPAHPHCQCWIDIVTSPIPFSFPGNYGDILNAMDAVGATESAFWMPDQFLFESLPPSLGDVHEVYCATGPGGGVDPSCTKGDPGSTVIYVPSGSRTRAQRELRPGTPKIEMSVLQPHEVAANRSKLGLDHLPDAVFRRLGGATDGATAIIRPVGAGLHFETINDDSRTVTTVSRMADGTLEAENWFFLVDKPRRGQGVGTEILKSQIDAATEAGVTKIVVHAIGDWSRRDIHNEYYTWPRLGFDGRLPDDWKSRMAKNGLDIVPDKLANATHVSDFFRLKDGRHLWKRFGFPLSLEFDLTPGSDSRRVFDAYYHSEGRIRSNLRAEWDADQAAKAKRRAEAKAWRKAMASRRIAPVAIGETAVAGIAGEATFDLDMEQDCIAFESAWDSVARVAEVYCATGEGGGIDPTCTKDGSHGGSPIYVGPARRDIHYVFSKPIPGPSGAELVGYEWRHEKVTMTDHRGEDVVRRISDWDRAATNEETGRQVVHVFHVAMPDGKVKEQSLETALKSLGFKTKSAATDIAAIAEALKERAERQAKLALPDLPDYQRKDLEKEVGEITERLERLARMASDPENTPEGRRGWIRRLKIAKRLLSSHELAGMKLPPGELHALQRDVWRMLEMDAAGRATKKTPIEEEIPGSVEPGGRVWKAIPASTDRAVKSWFANNYDAISSRFPKLAHWIARTHPYFTGAFDKEAEYRDRLVKLAAEHDAILRGDEATFRRLNPRSQLTIYPAGSKESQQFAIGIQRAISNVEEDREQYRSDIASIREYVMHHAAESAIAARPFVIEAGPDCGANRQGGGGFTEGNTCARGSGTAGRKQTDSAAFKKWFGDSVLVGDDGQPLVLYHGTSDEVSEFDLDHPHRKDSGWLGTGVYLTTSRDIANSYANLKGGSAGPNVMALYAKLENPYRAKLSDKQRLQIISQRQGKDAGRDAADAWTRQLKAMGHDGVIIDYPASLVGKASASQEVVVFSPAAVKSATGNRGTFDSSSSKISESSVAESGDPCGANAPGGGGFTEGNTCAKNRGSGTSDSPSSAAKHPKDMTHDEFVRYMGDLMYQADRPDATNAQKQAWTNAYLDHDSLFNEQNGKAIADHAAKRRIDDLGGIEKARARASELYIAGIVGDDEKIARDKDGERRDIYLDLERVTGDDLRQRDEIDALRAASKDIQPDWSDRAVNALSEASDHKGWKVFVEPFQKELDRRRLDAAATAEDLPTAELRMEMSRRHGQFNTFQSEAMLEVLKERTGLFLADDVPGMGIENTTPKEYVAKLRQIDLASQGTLGDLLAEHAGESVQGKDRRTDMSQRSVDTRKHVKSLVVSAVASKMKSSVVEDSQWESLQEELSTWSRGQGDDAIERVASAFVDSWAGSSGNGSKPSVAVQLAARDVLGLEGDALAGSDTQSLQSGRQFYERHKPAIQAYVRAMYDHTQKTLSDRGISHLTLYRGMLFTVDHMDAVDNPQLGNVAEQAFDLAKHPANSPSGGVVLDANLQANPLSSYSWSYESAREFAAGSGKQSVQVVTAATVPREDIFSLAVTGVGCLVENEAVVLGRPRTAKAYLARGKVLPDTQEEFLSALEGSR